MAHERLPTRLTIDIRERNVDGRLFVFQQYRGLNIGDRLTDNAAEQDDYRFHDVFHYANWAVLTWSPVARALLHLSLLSVTAIYDQLSEIAHPNGAGTQYLFPELTDEASEFIKTKESLRRIALSSLWHRFHLLDALQRSADLPEKFKASFLQLSP
jgi:hypothetical protein